MIFYLVLFETYSSVFSFCLIFCVYFYELGETAKSTSLEGMALCRSVSFTECMCLVAGLLVLEQVWGEGFLGHAILGLPWCGGLR